MSPMKSATLVALSLLATTAVASAQSAKAAAEVGTFAVIDQCNSNGCAQTTAWQTLLRATIHTSQQKDLVLGASLQTSLVTNTLVRSRGGSNDSSTAEAKIEVRIVVDPSAPNVGAAGTTAFPGVVTFDQRRQDVMARFGGVFECTGITLDTCTITDEILQLILNSTSANHFNFVLDDVGVGTHLVELQVRLNTNATWQEGSAAAVATIGKGSLTVEEVRFVKDASVVAQ
jgi:hypothetical protein